jgi:hypothetical protein
MAKQPKRGGLRWVKSNVGGQGSPPVELKTVVTAYAVNIFQGDLLKTVADGTVEVCAAGDAGSHVALAVVEYKDAEGTMRPGVFLPASTAYTGGVGLQNPLASKVLCIPVNGQVFEVDIPDAAASAAAATGYIGNAIDIVATAGSTDTGKSGFTTANVSGFAASTAQLKLIDIPKYGSNGMLNDPTTTYWKGYFEVYEQVTVV